MESSEVSVAFDMKRLVDAVAIGRPHQGITRYTLRLFLELRRNPGVSVVPVYLHPLDPRRIGVERTLQQTMALDELESTCGQAVMLPWTQKRVVWRWVRWLGRLERRAPSLPGFRTALFHVRRALIARSFVTVRTSSLRCDVFHSTVNPLPPQHRTPAKARVLTVHDCIYLKHPEFHPLPGRTPAIRKALDSLDRETDYVICDSENTRRDLHSFLDIDPARTWVVPLAADEIFFSPERELARAALSRWSLAPGRYVLALAQSEVRKNIPRLVASFRLLEAEFPDLRLLLVTEEHHVEELINLLESRDLTSPSVVVHSGVDDVLLAGLYAEAALFVYVPLYEGFGIPPLEAMAAGCPVVVAANSSLPEVVGEVGIYVDADEVESISQGLRRLLTDEPLARRLAQEGRTRSRSFSWSRTAHETVEVYRRLLTEREEHGHETTNSTVTKSSLAR